MTEPLYIWIVRWEDFQHYKPKRERGPAWIKQYTAQLDDERYLALTNQQRSLLADLRLMFSSYRARLLLDRRSIAARRRQRTFSSDLEALNHAGFIAIISRATLEQRLERLYNGSRAEVEVEKEEELEEPSVLPSEPRPQENGRTDEDITWDEEKPSNLQRRLAEEIARRTQEAMG